MTKRKTTEEKAAPKHKKCVAFTASRTAAKKALIARNASSSPLLRLPPEIRTKIWRAVVGDRLIHLEYSYYDGLDFEENDAMHASMQYLNSLDRMYGSAWRHIICQDDGPEDRDNTRITSSGSDSHGVEYLSMRPHLSCDVDYSLLSPGIPIEFDDHETMCLTILRSCRQGYAEANQILWTTNTFAFPNAVTLKRFMMTRIIHQKRMISSFRLEMEIGLSWAHQEWSEVLNMPLVKSLSGLRHLRLQIEYELSYHLYNTLKRLNMFYASSVCDGLHRLSTLPLTEVEVAVKDPRWVPDGTSWRRVDRVAYAAGLRELLLNPEGAGVYAAERLREKELLRKEKELQA